MTTVTVVTLNLWNVNPPFAERMRQLGEALSAERPDVLALQEVAPTSDGSQAHAIASGAGYRHVHLTRAGIAGIHGEGLAVLTDLPSRQLAPVRLPWASRDPPRSCQRVAIDLGDATLLVANTHLAWRLGHGEQRARQAAAIAGALAGHDGPLLVVGDLNDVPGSPAVTTLTDRLALSDALAGSPDAGRATFDHDNPWTASELAGRRIDHILVRGLTVVAAGLWLDGRAAPMVSDHYAARATFDR